MQALLLFLQIFFICYCIAKEDKKPSKIVETPTASKYDNPNFVRDRNKYEMFKPQMDEYMNNRFKKPFNPAWMDFCDPYHCNDYHFQACGLNRKTMRFMWFQSACHIILNNQCATYRGSLKYDRVANKYCNVYVMYLRGGCEDCDDGEEAASVCAVGTSTSHVLLFRTRCALDRANCQKGYPEYEEVGMFLCEFYLFALVK